MEHVVISLGGSLIVPDKVNHEFLKSFRDVIQEEVSKGKKFAVVAGGGIIARKYQEAGKEFGMNDEQLDWLGIFSTELNAKLLKMIFQTACPLIRNPNEDLSHESTVLVACGWQPGCSTDMDAVLIAQNTGAKKIINLSNIDYVYDKDPKKSDDAQPIKEINWADFRKMLPEEWNPGLNSPFDPVAAKKAEELGMEVVIMNGDPENLRKYFDGEEFRGTLIK